MHPVERYAIQECGFSWERPEGFRTTILIGAEYYELRLGLEEAWELYNHASACVQFEDDDLASFKRLANQLDWSFEPSNPSYRSRSAVPQPRYSLRSPRRPR